MARETSIAFMRHDPDHHAAAEPGTNGPIPLPYEVRQQFEQPYVFHPWPAWRYLYVKGVRPLIAPDEKHPEYEAQNVQTRLTLQQAGLPTSGADVVAPDLVGRIVQDESESRALGDRWTERPEQAKPRATEIEDRIAEQAAERNWADRRMSAGAKAELAAQDADAGFGHVLDPVVPKKRPRGRPVTRKTKATPLPPGETL